MKSHKKTKLEIYSQTIRLSTTDKRALRGRVLSYVEYHPLRTAPTRIVREKVAPFESFTYIRLSSWLIRPLVGTLSLIFIVGIPMLAERANPGDMLYPMKVRVNEEVQARLALSPYEKIAWNVTRVERRVAEARLLAKEGKLTNEAEASLAVTLKQHTDSAAKSIAELRATDANGAAVAQVSLESALDVQSAILASSIATGTTATSSTIAGIAAVVQTAKDAVTSAADAAPQNAQLSYEKMSAQVESETTRAHDLLTSVTTVVSPAEKLEIDRRFSDIDRAILTAADTKATGHEPEAIDSLKKTLGDIQKLIAFMTDIDVRGTVTIESLVPKKLTNDERITTINQTLDALKHDQKEIEASPVNEKADVAKKIASGIKQLPAMILDIETKREKNDFDGADTISTEARALADDIKKLQHTTDVTGTSTPITTTTSTSTSPNATSTATSTAQ